MEAIAQRLTRRAWSIIVDAVCVDSLINRSFDPYSPNRASDTI